MVPKDPVSILPSSFASDGGYLDMTPEEVVAATLDIEKRRHKIAKDDEQQQECVISVRDTPTGLMPLLTILSHDLGISRSLLTRCLSHRVAVWFDSLPGIMDVATLFYTTYQEAVDSGFPDICDGSRNCSYSFNNSAGKPNTFRSIIWAREKMLNLSLPLGLGSGHLFTIGICDSLLTSSIGKGMVEKYLRPEIESFSVYLKERVDDVQYFHQKLEKRKSG